MGRDPNRQRPSRDLTKDRSTTPPSAKALKGMKSWSDLYGERSLVLVVTVVMSCQKLHAVDTVCIIRLEAPKSKLRLTSYDPPLWRGLQHSPESISNETRSEQ
jgi:hypothetical protein